VEQFQAACSRRDAPTQQLDEGSRAFVSYAGSAPAIEQGGDRLRHLSVELRFVSMTNDEVLAARADFERGVTSRVVSALDSGRFSRQQDAERSGGAEQELPVVLHAEPLGLTDASAVIKAS
jgi:hypothetical protein